MNRIMERIHAEVARAGHHVDYLAAEDAPPARAGGSADSCSQPWSAIARWLRRG
jgi:hypothetical protein